MTKNRYVFDTTLTGYINVYEPSGKYNNCCFSFRLPPEVMEQAEADREELLDWARSKVENPKRIATNPPKWDDDGLVKYSYDGDARRQPPIFIDTEGQPVEKDVLKDVRNGTKVRLIVQQSPYTKPSIGTTLSVLGVQIVKLVAGNGIVDSGDLTVEDVASIFGQAQGYKGSAPAVRREESDTTENDGGYDF